MKVSLEKQLQRLFAKLPEQDQQSLIAFAEFLCDRDVNQSIVEPVVQTPVKMRRPKEETVPAAIKRLRQSYPMLDASELLAAASELMSQHLIQGRPAADIIDELEALFEHHYLECQLK